MKEIPPPVNDGGISSSTTFCADDPVMTGCPGKSNLPPEETNVAAEGAEGDQAATAAGSEAKRPSGCIAAGAFGIGTELVLHRSAERGDIEVCRHIRRQT